MPCIYIYIYQHTLPLSLQDPYLKTIPEVGVPQALGRKLAEHRFFGVYVV